MALMHFPIQPMLEAAARVSPGPIKHDVSTLLVRALSRLLTATVDTDLADGIGLSIGAAGAREQALEALAAWEASRNEPSA
ncbi:hypothetical protein [Sphingobium sp. Z007]|uniref:hypothetical protein n=1 Tax=Sphingobium sp. Z007 TaxID=627495 RepID=UPI000B4A180F|nr:hypothetical protein [Sphingobium sp. Z007]